MKTKIIPFDLVTAKKIQAGVIEGSIKTRQGNPVRLICTDLICKQCVVAAITFSEGIEFVYSFGVSGNHNLNSEPCEYDLVLEIPDNEPQLKPFDKVLVRYFDNGIWRINFFSHMQGKLFVCLDSTWIFCIPFEGNENLVGTTDKPKED